MKDIPDSERVYIDQMGIDEYIHREKARAVRGKRVKGCVSGKKYKRTNMIAAKRGKDILAPLEYKGTTDHILVEWWLINMLFPLLAAGCVIILDSASFHRKKVLNALAEEYGFSIIFLPPYSPDYNPLEKYWAWMKSYLKKIMHNYSCLCFAIRACFEP